MFLLLISSVLTAGGVFAQDTEDDSITWPEYPGGYPALYAYLHDSLIQIPVDNEEVLHLGRIFVRFEIDSVGLVQNVRILKGQGKLAEKAAVLIRNSKGWTPAKKYGVPTNFTLTMPIRISYH